MSEDRLENFGIYKLACQLFEDFWKDSEIVGKDYRGKELVKQQIRSLDSICANKEMPQHLKIARGEARESKGRYRRMKFLLSAEIIQKRVTVLDQIIGGLTTTINTIESKRTK